MGMQRSGPPAFIGEGFGAGGGRLVAEGYAGSKGLVGRGGQVAAPIPREPPVMRAVRPARESVTPGVGELGMDSTLGLS